MTDFPEYGESEQAIHLASRPGVWHLRRMTALPPGMKAVKPAPLTDEELGLIKRTRARRPVAWRFPKVPKAKRDSRHHEFSRLQPNSQVCDTEDRVDAWLTAAHEAYHSIPDDGSPDAATERPHWKRSTVQKGTSIHWFTGKIGPGIDGPRPRDMATWRAVGELLVERFRAVRPTITEIKEYDRTHPEPAETNPGYPTFGGKMAGKLVGACFITPKLRADDMLDFAHRFARSSGTPEEAILSYGLGGRSGPVYKWTDLPVYQGGTWIKKAEWRGHAQRNRIIQMSPPCFNKPLRSLASALKLCRKRLPGLWRHDNLDARLLAQFPFKQEADISGYDGSVTPFLQRSAAWAWKQIFPDLTAEIDFWLFCESRPLITPSWDLDDDQLEVVHAVGGTRSGLKHTAEVGSFIALWVTLYALARQGVDIRNWPKAQAFASTHQGDDVCISSRWLLDAQHWADSFAEIGLKCDLITGNGFLARHMLPNGTTAPIAGRIVQQTMSNEHEPLEGKPTGILYLGFLARTEGVEHLSTHWQDSIWKCIRGAKWIEETGAQTLSHLRHFLHTPDAEQVIKQALASSVGESWLEREARDAEHAAAARATVEAAARLGVTVSFSQDLVADTLSNAITQKDDAWRMQTALDGWSAISSSKLATASWMKRTAESLGHGELVTDRAA